MDSTPCNISRKDSFFFCELGFSTKKCRQFKENVFWQQVMNKKAFVCKNQIKVIILSLVLQGEPLLMNVMAPFEKYFAVK